MAFRTETLLDDTGWRVLAALQADARLSFGELGRFGPPTTAIILSSPAPLRAVAEPPKRATAQGRPIPLRRRQVHPG